MIRRPTRFLMPIGGFIIRDHNYSLGGYGHTTYKEAFKNHSNIAMARALFLADSTSFRDKLMYVFDNPRAMDDHFAPQFDRDAGR